MNAPDFRYKFYLKKPSDTDFTEVKNPDGWDEMVDTVRRDKELKGVFVTMDVTFTFQDDGYDLLSEVFDDSDYCAVVELLIEESRDAGTNFSTSYEGIIKISDVEFERKTRQAKTKVFDNSFFAKIYDNKNLEAIVLAGKSKNEEVITVPSFHLVQMFEPQTGNYYTIQTGSGKERSNACYRAYDLLKYMVAYMTDGEVGFDSALFGAGGVCENIMLTFGKVIRRTQAGYSKTDFENDFPVLTFQKLFTALDRRLNLGIFVDNSTGVPVLRVEKWDDLFKNNVAVQIPNIDVLKEKISTDDIYSQLKIGSNKTIDNPGVLQFPEAIRWVGFNSEIYNILGKCNIDRVFDLSDDFIVSSNVIEQILVNNTGDTTYDKDWFIINAIFDSGNTWKASRTNWISPTSTPPFYYNEYFINSEIAKRFLRAVPNSIALILGNSNDNKFQSTKTADVSKAGFIQVEAPVRYEDDFTLPNFDAPNNYGNGTTQGTTVSKANSRYTCPTGGRYDMVASNIIEIVTIVEPVYIKVLIDATLLLFPSIGEVFSVTGKGIIGEVINTTQVGVPNPLTMRRLTIRKTTANSIVNGDAWTTPSFKSGHALENEQVFTGYPVKGDIITQIYHYDANDVLINSATTSSPFSATGVYTVTASGSFNCNTGDYLIASQRIIPANQQYINGTWKILANSYFACTNAATGGGVFQTYDPADYPVIKDDFEIEIDSWRFDSIKNNPLSLIEFSRNDVDFIKGWCDEIRFSRFKQKATFRLLSAKNTR